MFSLTAIVSRRTQKTVTTRLLYSKRIWDLTRDRRVVNTPLTSTRRGPLAKNSHQPACPEQRNKSRSPPRHVKPSPSRVRRNSLQNSSSTPPTRMPHPTQPQRCITQPLASRILFQRGVYPSDDFQMVKKYGQTVLITQDAALEAYLDKFVFHSFGLNLCLY
jgi:hypothetical protein